MKLAASGFREYDARWLYPDDIDKDGMRQLGRALGTYLHEINRADSIVAGHDYRSYSEEVKAALIAGLVEAGCGVKDIGLSLSPMAYFAQAELKSAVAMITASHNENGWTGVKMGAEAPLTFGPTEISRLKDIALQQKTILREGGTCQKIDAMREKYISALTDRKPFAKKLRVVLACGSGTAGFFAPETFTKLGADVIPLHCEPDFTFPHYTPNPENIAMLNDLAAAVVAQKADLGLAFDGDGDRCGFVDEKGEIMFADKVGVLIARHLAALHPRARFIADVKSTGIFAYDEILRQHHATTEYWITGHSYMKRHLHETGALAGFEKSGHFFFAPPIGRGYDDGLLSGIMLCDMLANSDSKLSALRASLPQTWTSPSMAPFCPDEKKYQAVESIHAHYENKFQKGETIAGQKITELMTVNGVRIALEDGSWLLARASSNKPSLVIVTESVSSEDNMKALFADMDAVISKNPDIGDYDQKI